MTGQPVRFDDGAAYEQMMGTWSRDAGGVFIEWLQPPRGLRWVDVGCGNGAFAHLLIERCAPAALTGIDPSPGQLAYARERCAGTNARFEQGDAMALPFTDNSFDAATMALVIFFVPEPAQGVAEMARVVQPGGIVAAYAWDMFGDGFPHHAIQAELKAMGKNSMGPPRPDASRIDVMQSLWTAAGIEAVETRAITVRRSFANFDAYWQATAVGPFAPAFASMDPQALSTFKEGVRRRLSAEASGPITVEARANAVKGRVPR